MPRERSLHNHHQNQYFWKNSQEFLKTQSAKDRGNIRKKTASHRDIEDYFDHNKLRRNIVDSYEGDDDWDDLGDEVV